MKGCTSGCGLELPITAVCVLGVLNTLDGFFSPSFFIFLYGIHCYSFSFNARGRNARLCFFQPARGCGPKSCNDRFFAPVFSCARGSAIRAPFPRHRPVLIPPEPSARPLTVRRVNRTGTTDISRGKTWVRIRRCYSLALDRKRNRQVTLLTYHTFFKS